MTTLGAVWVLVYFNEVWLVDSYGVELQERMHIRRQMDRHLSFLRDNQRNNTQEMNST